MRSIERLPEAVHNSLRSGIVICDFTRVVEELVYNSLDSGSTKVSVAFGVGKYYVKVDDNGSGISRDGLLLLGEGHTTSKLDHVPLMDAGIENLDFHGEALCSISNISLLEIVTKARGKPNGYKKVLKNSKCVYLGIHDDRQEVGTTVIVRDIFYNQPVRRKHMESSPKKVLDSIKMTMLRIALVHANVSFKVVDVESAFELLRTRASSSPTSILHSYFGIDKSVTLYKLNISDGGLKLSGYVSDPREVILPKAIQYVYINSRFVSKGPIHTLVNQLAAQFDLLSAWQTTASSQIEKRSKYDMCPMFILNLHCSKSYYDNIIHGRTSVEFKDWDRVLALIENEVLRLWNESISPDKNMLCAFESGKKRCWKPNFQAASHLDTPWPKKFRNDYYHLPDLEGRASSYGKLPKISVPTKNNKEVDFLCEVDYLSRLRDGSVAGYGRTGQLRGGSASGYEITCNEIRDNPSPCCIDYGPHVLGEDEDRLFAFLENTSLEFNTRINNTPTVTGIASDCPQFSEGIDLHQEPSRKWLRSCSFRRSLLVEGNSPVMDERFELRGNGRRIEKYWIDGEDSMDNKTDAHVFGMDQHREDASMFHHTPRSQHNVHEILEFPTCGSETPSPIFANIVPFSFPLGPKWSSKWQCFKPGWSPFTAEGNIGVKFLDDGEASHEGLNGRSPALYSAQEESECFNDINLITRSVRPQLKCAFMNVSPDRKSENIEFHSEDFDNILCPKSYMIFRKSAWSSLPLYGPESPRNHPVSSSCTPSSVVSGCKKTNLENEKTTHNSRKIFIRSHSAPPHRKRKKRYADLTDASSMLSTNKNLQNISKMLQSTDPNSSIFQCLHSETRNLKFSKMSFDQYHPSPMEGPARNFPVDESPIFKLTPEVIVESGLPQTMGQSVKMESVECVDAIEILDSQKSLCKWRDKFVPSSVKYSGSRLCNKNDQDIILDITSDNMHLAGDTSIHKSIDRTSLEDAKVLNQVAMKFIAVVAGKNLAMIDQHAADERIRLEDLRLKVLSGEMKTIRYLDGEQQMVLPEFGYQLLQNYSEQIQSWGWMCTNHSQDTDSFSRHLDFLNRRQTVKLVAVPQILDTQLTDIDLLEFLQQLADTDGSSTMPPSVHRLLNNKACRGAIMFGDSLLPSECSLLVEELKQTSLCFQCAHGRPTIVPLVDLDLLHNRIANLGSAQSWHGLSQHKPTLERIALRLHRPLDKNDGSGE